MDERVWTDHPLAIGGEITGDGVTIRRDPVGALTLISGDLAEGLGHLAPGAALVGLGNVSAATDIALRIARDRALLVTEAPVVSEIGQWKHGCAVNRADGLYACLSITGPRAIDIVTQGTSVDVNTASPSAAVSFAGCTALLTGHEAGWRIWVEAPMLTYLSGWLKGAIDD